MKRSNWNWTKFMLGLAMIVFAFGAACGGSDTVASNDGGNPPVVTPPTGGGGGGGGTPPPVTPPPPPAQFSRSIDFEYCSSQVNVPKVQVLPAMEVWGDSADSFIFNQTSHANGLYCYKGTMARPNDPNWNEGQWAFAVLSGNHPGTYDRFQNCGEPTNWCYVNGQLDTSVLLGYMYQGELNAIVNGAHHLGWLYAYISAENQVSQPRTQVPCNDGSKPCIIDSSHNIH